MTDNWTAVIIAFLTFMGTLVTGVLSFMTLRQSRKAVVKSEEIAVKVDGHLSAMTEQIAGLTARNTSKDETISNLISRAPVTAPVTVTPDGAVKETPGDVPAARQGTSPIIDTSGRPISSGDKVVVTKEPK